MKNYSISLPTKPDSIETIDDNEGLLWFKKHDISIDFTVANEEIIPKQVWFTSHNLIELTEVPFLMEWITDVLSINKDKILELFTTETSEDDSTFDEEYNDDKRKGLI